MGTPMVPHPQLQLQLQPPSSSSNDQFNNMALHNPNPYLSISPVQSSGKSPMGRVCDALNRCGKKVEVLADNIWNHLRVSPSFTNATVARLTQGTKVLAEGGYERLFQQTFQFLPGEKLLNAYVCYLSTSSGPVSGTLYISNKRIAFCSDYPLCFYPSPGYQQWMYYKVMVELDKLATVNPSANRLNPSQKYIHIVTRDGHEFWFMGFISYDKAFKHLTEALQHTHHAPPPF